MPYVTATDGVELYYEETGSGTPIIFVHEFGGDYRHWEPQMRFFSRSHRCIAFNARGYPPSAVPEDPDMYSQNNARDDVLAILDGLAIEQAHINGLSMGGFASLHFGFEYPDRALSLVVAGCGYGAKSDHKEQFFRETTEVADRMENETMAVFGKVYALDIKDGSSLWNFNTGAGNRAGIISYQAKGEQFILFPTGFGCTVKIFEQNPTVFS